MSSRSAQASRGGRAPANGALHAERRRQTKIIATLGPATDRPTALDELVAAGIDCARVNCSHSCSGDHRRRIRALRASAHRLGRTVGVLVDLQGPKLRLGAKVAERIVDAGELVVFGPAGGDHAGDVPVEIAAFADLVSESAQIVIGDGAPRFEVTEITDGRVSARAVTSGTIGARKGVSLSGTPSKLPAITEKDRADLLVAVEEGAEYVALSFVRSAAEVQELRSRLRELGSAARVIAKIERTEALDHLDEIVAHADGIMVARGDYGVEAGLEQVPLMQKEVVRRATEAGALVITATQMLESMVSAPQPTRAEACDVANAIIDGSSALMLSAETAVGAYPVEAVSWMDNIARAVEGTPDIRCATGPASADGADAAVLRSAVALAEQARTHALIVATSTGDSARACAKYRPYVPVIALAHDAVVANQLCLAWGVFPTTIDRPETTEDLIEACLARACELWSLSPGSAVVLTAGSVPGRSGGTDLIALRRVGCYPAASGSREETRTVSRGHY